MTSRRLYPVHKDYTNPVIEVLWDKEQIIKGVKDGTLTRQQIAKMFASAIEEITEIVKKSLPSEGEKATPPA